MHDDEMRALLIEYMGKGFLENIISLMRQDLSALRFIPDLVGNDALMVRLGATALVEELAKDHRQALAVAVPGLITLLRHENPTLRGDAANVLGIIGGRAAREALLDLQRDSNAAVREIAEDALVELERGNGPAGARAAGQGDDTRR
jgi:HEAT repeat protein